MKSPKRVSCKMGCKTWGSITKIVDVLPVLSTSESLMRSTMWSGLYKWYPFSKYEHVNVMQYGQIDLNYPRAILLQRTGRSHAENTVNKKTFFLTACRNTPVPQIALHFSKSEF